MSKTAVILFNLGGPDSKEAIEPFLMNFFMDPNIIALPYPLRWALAKLISKRRSKREAGESYGALGDCSPLLENSQEQATALEAALGKGFKTFICMRYWHPMGPEVVAQVQDWGAEKIILLPLYPQFSTTTAWSSLGVWNAAMRRAGLKIETSMVCCYPFNEGFIAASAENIQTQIAAAKKDGHAYPRILFSAHGLPEDIIKKGDPYQWQCEQSAERIVECLEDPLPQSLSLKGEGSGAERSRERVKKTDWTICYQSRVGPKKWIGPSLDEELERAARDKVPVIIYPHAFTQEHVETLVELDIEYKEKAQHLGLSGYYRAQTVGTHPAFIDGLAQMVRGSVESNKITGEGGKIICPEKFTRCCMRSAYA